MKYNFYPFISHEKMRRKAHEHRGHLHTYIGVRLRYSLTGNWGWGGQRVRGMGAGFHKDHWVQVLHPKVDLQPLKVEDGSSMREIVGNLQQSHHDGITVVKHAVVLCNEQFTRTGLGQWQLALWTGVSGRARKDS